MTGGLGRLLRPPVEVLLDVPPSVDAGEDLGASVAVRARRAARLTGGEVALLRTVVRVLRTGGAGSLVVTESPQAAVVARVRLRPSGPLAAGDELSARVRLPVPGAEPGTAAGRLVTVSYALVARAAVERGRDARATEPVRVLAGRRALPDLSDGWVTGDAGVRLRCDVLSRRDVAPGDRLTGVLEVAAYEDLAAAALHLELVVVEDVPDVPPGHAETVVAALPLLPAQPWACGRAELVPFAFDLPPVLTAPTLRTGSASVDWELRGVLTAGPATAEVRVPLVARTGAREATPG